MQIEFPDGGPIKFAVRAATQTFPTIGAFYDAIQDAFNQLAPSLTTARQLTSKGRGIAVSIIQTPTDVSNAISLIKVQGEGTMQSPSAGQGTADLAHYYRFAELYVGRTLVAQTGGGFAFTGPAIPFPDTFTMAPIPVGGYKNPSPAAKTALATFDNLFSDLLDKLDTAWSTGSSPSLGAAIADMRALAPAAQALFAIPLPSPEDGFYGPDFRYIPQSERKTSVPGASTTIPSNPTYSDIVNLLQTLTGNDPNLDANSPHGAFWNQSYAAFMAQTTDAWGVPGSLVVKCDINNSNLFLALAGTGAFTQMRMPDPNDPNSRFATSPELHMVSTWIANGCPQ
jgi:hypothetical protein